NARSKNWFLGSDGRVRVGSALHWWPRLLRVFPVCNSESSCRPAAPRNHENGLSGAYPDPWCLLSGRRPVFPLGATSPPLSLAWAAARPRRCRRRPSGEHAEQAVCSSLSSGVEAHREDAMDALYPRCAGIDVHKSNAVGGAGSSRIVLGRVAPSPRYALPPTTT